MVVTTGIPVVPAITTDDVALIIDANEAREIQTDSNFYCQFGDPETFKNSRFQQVTYWARTSQPNSTMAKLRKLDDLRMMKTWVLLYVEPTLNSIVETVHIQLLSTELSKMHGTSQLHPIFHRHGRRR
jgi:hypothetical protein